MGSRATRRTPAARASMGPETNLAEAVASASRPSASRASRRGSRRSRRRGCRSTTCTGRRRSWCARPQGRGHAGRPRRRARAAARDRRRRAQGLAAYDVVYVRVGQGKSGARRAAHSAGGAGRGDRARQQHRRHPRGRRRLLVSAEPAQPRDAVAAPAGLDASSRSPISRRCARACSPTRSCAITPITLPPIGGSVARTSSEHHGRSSTDKDYWTPKNYSGGGGGVTTLRRALENSKNLVTANLLDGVIELSAGRQPAARLRTHAVEAQLYKECVRYYPFVLGAQPVRLVDLAAFYAAIANEGARPSPHVIESVEQNGRTVYRNNGAPIWLGVRRPRRVLSVEVDAAGRRRARHRQCHQASRALCRRQDRHQRRRERRAGSSASPTKSRSASGSAMTTPTASGARSARGVTGAQGRDPDLRADDAGGVGNTTRREPRWRGPRRKRAVSWSPLPINLLQRRSAARRRRRTRSPNTCASIASGSSDRHAIRSGVARGSRSPIATSRAAVMTAEGGYYYGRDGGYPPREYGYRRTTMASPAYGRPGYYPPGYVQPLRPAARTAGAVRSVRKPTMVRPAAAGTAGRAASIRTISLAGVIQLMRSDTLGRSEQWNSRCGSCLP